MVFILNNVLYDKIISVFTKSQAPVCLL